MQISQKAKEHIESCRFCWMCHHICPIGNATGLERNTARARALGLSLVTRNAIDFSDDIINNIYECSLCGGCVADCTTGWDPVMYTKEARLAAALEGKLPEYVTAMLKNFEQKGNIYGKDTNISEINGGDTLFFLGEDTRVKGDARAAIDVLKKAGVDFTVLKDEPGSGYSIDFLIAAAAETKAVMENCAKVLNNYKKIICYDPADAKVIKREYKEYGVNVEAQVLTFTEFLAELIRDKKLAPKNSGLELTPQDSPLLARDLEETEPLREILSACGTVNEMLLNRKAAMLAGNLIMNEYMPKVMQAVAENRWINAKNANAKVLVTASTAEYALLAETNPDDIELKKLEEVVLGCL